MSCHDWVCMDRAPPRFCRSCWKRTYSRKRKAMSPAGTDHHQNRLIKFQFKVSVLLRMCITHRFTCSTCHIQESYPWLGVHDVQERVFPQSMNAQTHGIIHEVILLCHILKHLIHYRKSKHLSHWELSTWYFFCCFFKSLAFY